MTDARASRRPEELIATFGRRLRVLRLWNGLSEAEMAVALGISVRSLKRREAGTTVGTRGMMFLMIAAADTFDVSIDWLAGRVISETCRDETRPVAPGGLPLSEPPLERFLS